MTTKNAGSRNTGTNSLSPALRTITLHDALEAFDELNANFHIVAHHSHDEIRADMTSYIDTAADAGVTDVFELVTRRTAVITAASGVSHPTQILNSADSASVHRASNLLLVLALSGAASIGADTQPITDAWITLKARTADAARALVHDEIVLLRTTLATQAKDADKPGLPNGFTDCTDTGHLTRVTAYALTEAGMTAGETTSVSLDDIACIDGVLYVSAPGNDNLSSRVIELDHFEAGAVLALHQLRTLDPAWHATQPLTYQQNTTLDPQKSSAVCASNRLNRIMIAAGLRHSDTTATSICRWRYQLTFDTQGLNAAVQQSGYPKQHLLWRIVLPIPTEAAKAERTNALWDAFAA